MLVQCRYNMRKLLFILFCLVSLVSKGQVYQEMPQYGYRANRMAFDSTLSIPTVCGVPTLKSNVTKKAAIAFDSCNNKFYKYNPKTATWGEIGGIDTTSLSNRINSKADTSALNLKLNISDTTNMLSPYAKISLVNTKLNSSDTASLSNRINLKLNSSDTLSLSNRINLKMNYSDTSSLSNRINTKLNITDTTNKWVNNIYKKNGIDSIFFKIGSTEYKIKDSAANLSGYVPYTGATQDVDLGTHILNAQSIGVKGTNGNGHIDLRHQASDPIATGQTTALFANSNGDLKWKNAGNYYTTLTTQQTADRVYTFQNKSYTLADSSDVANKVNISDTSTMLSKYLRKTDTTSMLSPYARTSSLSSYLSKSDSTIFYPIYRSDSSRTNIYNALNGKQSALTFSTGLTNTSGTITNNLSVGISGGQSVVGGTAASNNLTLSSTSNATKGKIILGTASAYDQANDRIGVGTTSPTNPLDIIRGGAGTMARNNYESGSYVYNGDMKVGVYTSSTNSAHGAAISFGQTNLLTNSRYAGFDMQYVYSATVASNAWRINYTERSSVGVVQNYTANILQCYADGSVIINPSTLGVTASAKLLVGTATNAGYMLDVNGTARATQFYLSALNTAPASATATGTTGEIRIDANYIYICTATNTWKRVAIATW